MGSSNVWHRRTLGSWHKACGRISRAAWAKRMGTIPIEAKKSMSTKGSFTKQLQATLLTETRLLLPTHRGHFWPINPIPPPRGFSILTQKIPTPYKTCQKKILDLRPLDPTYPGGWGSASALWPSIRDVPEPGGGG